MENDRQGRTDWGFRRLAQGEHSHATRDPLRVPRCFPGAHRRTSFRAPAALIIFRNAGLRSPCASRRFTLTKKMQSVTRSLWTLDTPGDYHCPPSRSSTHGRRHYRGHNRWIDWHQGKSLKSRIRIGPHLKGRGVVLRCAQLALPTDDKNARSALECGREAAAFPWT